MHFLNIPVFEILIQVLQQLSKDIYYAKKIQWNGWRGDKHAIISREEKK